MTGKYFSHNGTVLPIGEANVSLDSVEYSYGFGVYETIRVSAGQPRFLEDHCTRLMLSAEAIDLEHTFSVSFVSKSVLELLERNGITACNIKILLIGGQTKGQADLYVLCLQPLFPDRKLFKTGAHCITHSYERLFPHAKTLNMLPSYLAYRHAKTEGAYDALLINRNGCITEGTRTNFFCIKDKTIISPPELQILPGVTRDAVLRVAAQNGYAYKEADIKLEDVPSYDGAFITSTSSKIIPLRSIDELSLDIPEQLRNLIKHFDAYLKTQ